MPVAPSASSSSLPWRAGLIGALVGAGALVPLAYSLSPQAQAQAQPASTAAVVSPAPPLLVSGLPDFTRLVEVASPSVVNIRTTEYLRGLNGRRGGPAIDPHFEEFLRRFGIPLPGDGAPRGEDDEDGPNGNSPARRGVGSGFIISADGYVMTNAHVVDGADELLVTLTDKREFKAKVIGADKRSDIAIIKIDATGLPALRMGDVNRLKVGEWVIAIGSPFNLDNTVTAGIVSAKQRETGDLLPFIQTDVAINPGNSGGPLLNMRGEVVGINSQIYSPSGASAGISFSIPVDEAMRVADQLRATGHVVRGRIGVGIAPVTPDVAKSLGLPAAHGALVRNVEPGSPAEKAGLEPGDIITQVNGRAIEREVDLPRVITSTAPGQTVRLQVFRRGAYKDYTLQVADLDNTAKAQGKEQPSTAGEAALGLVVSDLTAQQKRALRLSGGVRVDSADPPASRAGLRTGDVILQIDNAKVSDLSQYNAIVAKLDKNKPVTLLVRRGDWVNYVVIRPAATN